MRDLGSRLREIVRRDHGGPASSPAREHTYVSETSGAALAPDIAAAALGGVPDPKHPQCIVIDRVWDDGHWHGRRQVGRFAPARDWPLATVEPRLKTLPAWAERVIFFDLETTGLSGGAGTLPFLAGLGWFEDGAFRVRQFFLAAASAERAMLDVIGRLFDDATLLVTFNGRSFDVPLMGMRWAFHRADDAASEMPHLDMLHVSRRLWGRREQADAVDRASCTLSALEQTVLGFHRLGDVPGFEIPVRYFHFLRTGDASAIQGVLEHNRHDLLSLAGVMWRALALVQDGPSACRDEAEQMGLGRIYERAGDDDRAIESFRSAARAADRDVRAHSLARLALLLGRKRRYAEAADAWRDLWDLSRAWPGMPPALSRRAAEALAVHHEHRVRDLPVARNYALELNVHAQADGRRRENAAHRLNRIDKKLNGRLI